jgi:hypothetical protein
MFFAVQHSTDSPKLSPTLQLLSTSMRLGLFSPIQTNLSATLELRNPPPIFTDLHDAVRPDRFRQRVGSSRQHPNCFLLMMLDEIVVEICVEIMRDRHAASSLPRLARTCRAINRVAVVLLYGDIHGFAHSRFPVLHLQRTLYVNQDLNKLVKSLSFLTTRLEAVYAVNRDFRDCPEYSTALSQLFGLDPAEASSVQEPVNMMMLARLAPNLKQLCLNADRHWRNTDFLLAYNNRRVTGPRFTFNSLRDLHISYKRPPGASPNTGLSLQKLKTQEIYSVSFDGRY